MVVVSFECLLVVVVVGVNHFFPRPFQILGDAIMDDAEVVKWIPVIPLALCAYCFSLAWKLTTPLDGSNSELFEWPDYWRLKMRRGFSLFLSILCAITACGLWIFSKALTHSEVGIVFALTMGISLINTGCMAFATFTLREILECKQDQSKEK